VVDASKGMSEKIDDTTKLAAVKLAVGESLSAYQDRLSFGLLAFGHRQTSNCADTQLLAKPGDFNSKTKDKLLGGIKSKGQVPIAASLTDAAKAGSQGKLDIVLIAGALDSCTADYCGTAELLKKKTPALRIHVLAFDAKATETLAPLTCIAEKTGGRYVAAANVAELKQGFNILLDAAASPAASPTPVANAPAPPSAPAKPNDVTASVGADIPAPSEAVAGGGEVAIVGPLDNPVVEPAPGQSEVQKSVAAPPQQKPAAPALPVPVTFQATLTEGGPKLQTGITWRVFANDRAPNGTHKLLSTHREASPTAALLPGDYLVNAAYGLSNLTKLVKVESGKSIEETFVLNTGALKLGALLDEQPLPPGAVHFDIMSDEEDQFGNRRTVLANAKPGLVIRLNAGAYHVVSTYGDANATVRADVTVEPGKLTEATVKHAAAAVTLKLVQEGGGEALADTQWTILTTSGDMVKETTGALPTHILAEGNYAVVARHGGLSYTSRFSVESGQPKQIEVVVEAGPTSAEALREITNPTPPPSADTMPDSFPPDADTGTAFDGSQQPRPSGPLLNPGILLRPQLR
jgi:hypothetical protein